MCVYAWVFKGMFLAHALGTCSMSVNCLHGIHQIDFVTYRNYSKNRKNLSSFIVRASCCGNLGNKYCAVLVISFHTESRRGIK